MSAPPIWRLFAFSSIYEAEAFAAAGGIAIHLSGDWIPPGRSKLTPCAHIFGPDRETLTAAAVELGLRPDWIQYPDNPRKMHFDVWGSKLAAARRRCVNAAPHDVALNARDRQLADMGPLFDGVDVNGADRRLVPFAKGEGE